MFIKLIILYVINKSIQCTRLLDISETAVVLSSHVCVCVCVISMHREGLVGKLKLSFSQHQIKPIL